MTVCKHVHYGAEFRGGFSAINRAEACGTVFRKGFTFATSRAAKSSWWPRGKKKEVQAFLAALVSGWPTSLNRLANTTRTPPEFGISAFGIEIRSPLIQHHHDVICTAFGVGFVLALNSRTGVGAALAGRLEHRRHPNAA